MPGSGAVTVLRQGELDLPDDVLAEADYVGASLHYGASKREQDNTRRLVAAARHPHVDAIGHPTGRLLGRRDAYPLDAGELARACADTGCLLELNGSPERMDLPDALAQAAAGDAPKRPAKSASKKPAKSGVIAVVNGVPIPASRAARQRRSPAISS